MACDSPYVVNVPGRVNPKIPVPCGRCAYCKETKTNQWIFRIMQEDKVAKYAAFITLTYDTRFVPISSNGFMTLCKEDVVKYMKRLRKATVKRFPHSLPLRYYFVGEYGSIKERPHYHAVVFNVPDENLFRDAWILNGDLIGKVDVGTVKGASIAYVCKYIQKEGRIPKFDRDDRLPEFSLMSKGLGKNYVTDMRRVNFHKADYTRQYVVDHQGKKIPMPKYYRDYMFDSQEKATIRALAEKNCEESEEELRKKFFLKNRNATELDFVRYKEGGKMNRYNRYYSKSKKRRKDV